MATTKAQSHHPLLYGALIAVGVLVGLAVTMILVELFADLCMAGIGFLSS